MTVSISTWDVALRLLMAGGFGAVIGLEREARRHAAGMRTHALVASGAALFTLAGAYGFADIARSANVDPMRVAAQVVSGIGFVGAGAIIRHGMSVRGLTTAATLWACAAVGMAAGAGFYQGAVVGVVTVLVVLLVLRLVQDASAPLLGMANGGAREVSVEVVYERGVGTIAAVLTAVESEGGSVVGLGVEDEGDRAQPGLRRAVVRARTGDPNGLEQSLDMLSGLPEVRSVRVRAA